MGLGEEGTARRVREGKAFGDRRLASGASLAQMDDVGQAIRGQDMSVEENMRERILEVLDFFGDAGAQRAYQERVPSIM